MIGIIFINDINVCPYLDKYIAAINNHKKEYEIIIWDRTYEQGKVYKYPCKHIYKKSLRKISTQY